MKWFQHAWNYVSVFDESNNYDFNRIIGIFLKTNFNKFLYDFLLFLCKYCKILILQLVQSTDSLHLLYLCVSYVCAVYFYWCFRASIVWFMEIFYMISLLKFCYYYQYKIFMYHVLLYWICIRNGMRFIWTRNEV